MTPSLKKLKASRRQHKESADGMTKQEFKIRWESDENGGGITFDDISRCYKLWGLGHNPKTKSMDLVRYLVLKSANTIDAEYFKNENK